MKHKRIIDLDSGKYMVVADIHGNLPDYEKIKEIYQKKKEAGEVKGLIIAGDIIHTYGGEDKSKEIVDNLIELTKNDENVHVLLGNHEMASIYNFTLVKPGFAEFTYNLELAIKDNREKYIDFFKSFPFYIRTKGGIIISHAGPSKGAGNIEEIIKLDHDEILEKNKEEFEALSPEEKTGFKRLMEQEVYGASFEKILKEFRGIDPQDKEKSESFLQGEFFFRKGVSLLGDILFNGNEESYGPLGYLLVMEEFLEEMSKGYTPQNLIISGHVHPKAGFEIFEHEQLRIASSAEIVDPAAKSFIIIDAGKEYLSAKELAENVHSLYSEATDETLLEKVENISKKYPIKTEFIKVLLLENVKPEVLWHINPRLFKRRAAVEGGVKPKSKNLNENLLKVVEELEKRNVKIGDITTDGGSFYRIGYEELSKKEEESPKDKAFIQIGYNTVIDHNPTYGNLSITEIQSGSGFAHQIQVPVGEGRDEKGNRVVYVEYVSSDRENIDRIVKALKEKKDIEGFERIKPVLKKLVFKCSVLEDPYTDLSEEEFFKKLLEQESEQTP